VVGNYAKVDVEASSRVYRCSGGWVYVRDVDTKWAGWLPPAGNCSGRANCE